MKTFEAVLIFESGRITPALGLDLKGGRRVVETVFGKRYTLAPEKLLWREALVAESRADGLAQLRRRLAEAEALRAEVDVELLWESVVGEADEARSLRELTEIYFRAAADLAHQKAIDLAVGEGGDFFVRSGVRFRAVSRAERDRIQARQAAEAERRRSLEATVSSLAARLEAGGAAPGGEDRRVEAGLEQVLAYVRQGSGPGEAIVERLRARLDAADPAPGVSLRRRGLDLLVWLGAIVRPSDVLVDRYRLNRTFAPEHVAAVAAVRAAVGARVDLPDAAVEAYTIDDEGTEDFDDALSVGLEKGAVVLGVHIADPSPYLPIGSPLDDEAYTRGTTVYLPDRKYPMFPSVLSEDLLSLRAGAARPVLSFYFRFETGAPAAPAPRIVNERLVVRRNLSYEAVDALLGSEAAVDGAAVALRAAARVTDGLRAERQAAGATAFYMPELKIRVDEAGVVHLKRLDTGTPARRLVSEAMILVNAAGARFLRERAVPAIYRAQHPAREPVRIPEAYDPLVFRREVRKMVRARLTLEPEPHAGLGLDCYTQLSSPLRRYADLVMHRQLSGAVQGRPVPYPDRDVLLQVVVTSEMNYQTAVETERKSKHAWALRYLEGRLGESFEAIALEPLPGRGDVMVELADTGLVGRFVCPPGAAPEPGTRGAVRLKAIDVIEEEIVLELPA
ncbi:MAG: RNB domain-containing ribonuclease [Planctomycetes bacterium]|nr:RNB domain-containing ribonuclease [Planctomycetota bacterium]